MILLALLMAGKVAIAGDWSQSRGTSQNTGENSSEVLAMPLVPAVDLSFIATGSDKVYSQGSSIIVGTTIYVTTSDGVLLQASRLSGAEAWRFLASGPYSGGPAVADGAVVAGSRDGRVSAFVQNGGAASLWNTFQGGAIATAPTVAVVSGETRIFFGTGRGTLLCLRVSDGSTKWTFDAEGPIWGAPALNEAGTRVYFGSYDHRVYCLNASDGALIWATAPALIPLGPIRSPISVFGDRLYIPTLTSGLWSLQDQGGQAAVMWSLTWTGFHCGGAAVVRSSGMAAATIYVANTKGDLYGIEDLGLAGSVVWTRSRIGRVEGGVAFADNVVFVGTASKVLLAFRSTDGTALQEMPTHDAVNADPAVGRGIAGVVDDAGHFVAYGNVLETPLDLSAVEDGTVITLNWTPEFVPPAKMSPVSGYNVYRSLRMDGGFTLLSFVGGAGPGGVAVSTYTDSTAEPFVPYYYEITALNQVGASPGLVESSYSDIVTAVVVPIPAQLSPSFAFSPPVASPGQWVTVTLTVTNTGGGVADAVFPSLSIANDPSLMTLENGPSPSSAVTLAAGTGQTFTWTWSVNGTGLADFSAAVSGHDRRSGASVSTVTDDFLNLVAPTVLVVFSFTGAPVTAEVGQQFVMTLSVFSRGPTAVDLTGSITVTGGAALVTLVTGPGPVALRSGSLASFSWTYRALGAGLVQFAAGVSGTTVGTGLPVSVGTVGSEILAPPASLISTLSVTPNPATVGQWVTVTANVRNTGGFNALAVTPTLGVDEGSGLVVEMNGPVPSSVGTLGPGVSKVFTWTYSISGAGKVEWSMTVIGIDQVSGDGLSASAVASLLQPAHLAASLATFPNPGAQGQWITVTATVTNTGDIAATAVTPMLGVDVGGSLLFLESGPLPSSVAFLTGGTAQTFTWTYSATGAGSPELSLTVTGSDALSGTPLIETATRILTLTQPLPTVLIGLSALAFDGYVALSWQIGANQVPLSAIRVYRQEGPAGPLVLIRTLSGAETSFEDWRVEDQNEYRYTLVGVNMTGQEGEPALAVATPDVVDWPMYQRDTLHDASDSSVLLTPPLGEAWRVKLATDGGRGFSGYQGGLILGGTVFVVSTGGDVLACNAVTGATIWLHSGYLNDGGQPVLHHGLLYVFHASGLTVFRQSDGAIVWSLSAAVAGIGQPASPIVYRGLLIGGVILNSAFQVVAIDIDPSSATYRQVRWTLSMGINKTSPAAANGVVYMADANGFIHARMAESGAFVWDTRLVSVQAGVTISLFVAPPILVVNNTGVTSGLDLATGQSLWDSPTGATFTAPASAGATVYIASGATQISALNASSGAAVWIANTATSGPSGPVVTQHTVHVCSPSGEFASFDQDTGAASPALQLSNTSGYIASLAAGAGFVYVPVFDGQLIAVTSVPPAPIGLVVTVMPAGLQLTWTPAGANRYPLSGYRIFRSTDILVRGTLLAQLTGAGAATYLDAAVISGQPYYYRVQAMDIRSVAGVDSNLAVGIYPLLLAKITSPTSGSVVCLGQPVQIRGTAMSTGFGVYFLQVNQGAGYFTVASSTIPVVNGILGTFTPTITGLISVRLTVLDTSGKSVTTSIVLNSPAKNLLAVIQWPANGQSFFTGHSCRQLPLSAVGTASGSNFGSYTLRVWSGILGGPLVFAYTQSAPVVSGVLGSFTLPGCGMYFIELDVFDICGRQQSTVTAVSVRSLTSTLISSFSTRGRDLGDHRLPQDVVVDHDDFVWVVDTQNRRVQKYTADGQFLFEFGGQAAGSATGVTFSEPIAAAVDSRNRLLVLDRLDGTIKRFDESGHSLDQFGGTGVAPGQFRGPEGLAVDAQDRIYVADTLNGRVQMLTPDGQSFQVYGDHGGGPGVLQHPTGVSIDPDNGRILVTDQQENQMTVFDTQGAVFGGFGVHGAADDQFNHPYEAVVGHDRNLFVTDTDNNRTAWWTLFDTIPTQILVLPSDGDQPLFKHPHGIALNTEESMVFVADTGNNRILGIPIKELDDVRAPRAVITAPSLGATVTGVVEVSGIAADAHFASYTLDVGAGEGPSTFMPIATSTMAVWDDQLALWDTTGLSVGVYTLRLTVTDKSGNVTEARQIIIVGTAEAALISAASISPGTFTLDQDLPMIAYRLARNAEVLALVLREGSNHPVWVAGHVSLGAFGGLAGANSLIWDGRSDQGLLVPPGKYFVIIAATSGGVTDRRTLQLTALGTPELLAGQLGGGGGSHGTSVSGGSTGTGKANGAAGTSSSSLGNPHDNGWHDGNNPNSFVIDHNDKSRGHRNGQP